MVFHDPLYKSVRWQYAGDWREIDRVLSCGFIGKQVENLFRKFIIVSISYYELNFIPGSKPEKIFQVIAFMLSAGGTFYVDNPYTAIICNTYILAAICLNQDLVTAVQQVPDQGRCFFLNKWLSSRDFNKGTFI